MNRQTVSGLLTYVGTAFVALIAAAWLSTQFMAKAISQTNPPPAADGAAAAPGTVPSTAPGTAPGAADGAPAAVKSGAASTEEELLSKKKNPLADIIEDYNYSPKDKRDPFTPFERPHGSEGVVGPLWPLQSFDLDQLHLVGIIWDVKNPKAMITDPNGKGYVVKVNERIGRNNGYIARIREGEIVVVESVVGVDGKLAYTTKLIKLQTD